jgi:hypothetical protein
MPDQATGRAYPPHSRRPRRPRSHGPRGRSRAASPLSSQTDESAEAHAKLLVPQPTFASVHVVRYLESEDTRRVAAQRCNGEPFILDLEIEPEVASTSPTSRNCPGMIHAD